MTFSVSFGTRLIPVEVANFFVSTFAGRSIVESVEQDHVGEILREITKLVDQGKLKPLLDSEQFKFSSVARAHDYAENQGPTGKVVLTADL